MKRWLVLVLVLGCASTSRPRWLTVVRAALDRVCAARALLPESTGAEELGDGGLADRD